MAKVKDVLIKYHKTVPFPWSIRKIKKAGLDPSAFILEIGRELGQCEDAKSETAGELIRMLKELDLLL